MSKGLECYHLKGYDMSKRRRDVIKKAGTEISEVKCVEYCVEEHKAASMKKGRKVYVARVVEKEVYYLEDTIDRMRANGCLADESIIRLVLHNYFKLVKQLVSEGRAVAIPEIVRFAPAIRGTFDSPEESWNPKKHKVVVNATISKKMQKVAEQSPIRRVEVEKGLPLNQRAEPQDDFDAYTPVVHVENVDIEG